MENYRNILNSVSHHVRNVMNIFRVFTVYFHIFFYSIEDGEFI
jgi:hypothetical protein